MGPPIFIGGNNGLKTIRITQTSLQWGRRFSSAEIIELCVYLATKIKASMGPPIFIGGNPGTIDSGYRGEIASMGPPIFIGGNPICGGRRTATENASMGPPIFIGGNSV